MTVWQVISRNDVLGLHCVPSPRHCEPKAKQSIVTVDYHVATLLAITVWQVVSRNDVVSTDSTTAVIASTKCVAIYQKENLHRIFSH